MFTRLSNFATSFSSLKIVLSLTTETSQTGYLKLFTYIVYYNGLISYNIVGFHFDGKLEISVIFIRPKLARQLPSIANKIAINFLKIWDEDVADPRVNLLVFHIFNC